MNRSFDRRIESLFVIKDAFVKQQVINILIFNLNDNMNSYDMNEDGTYVVVNPIASLEFDIQKEFFRVNGKASSPSKLF